MNVSHIIRRHVAEQPEKTAIIFGDRRISYAELDQCVGVPDELKGEAPKAFVQLNEGETSTLEEIRDFCKPRMAPYKVPVAVEFVHEIPRSAAGKALRRLLRDKE